MPKSSVSELFQLYKQDKLVVHTMPTSMVDKRPQHMADKTSMMCGSILFYAGLEHQKQKHLPNAVARFGPDSGETLFATVHSLDAIFDTHEALEKQKPTEKQGKAFVLFANSDIGNLTKKPEVGEPPKDYLQTVYGETPPVQTERTRSFNFREFCQKKDEKEDPSMEEEGNEWNEMRAVLNNDNMVGLLYIHDPQNDPKEHLDIAKKLSSNFDNQFEMLVFKLRKPGDHQGDLLVVMEESGEEIKTEMADNAPAGKSEQDEVAEDCNKSDKPCRLVTFWEYVKKQDKNKSNDKQDDSKGGDDKQDDGQKQDGNEEDSSKEESESKRRKTEE